MRTFVLLLAGVLCCGGVRAAVPQTLNYQGYLTNSAGMPVNGRVVMTFRLYNAASGGSALWTETQLSGNVANGIVFAVLGVGTPIPAPPSDVPYWLTGAVGTAQIANKAVGNYATVSGGSDNQANGAYSVAMGRRAIVNSTRSFVFPDGTDADFVSGANNAFIVGAPGGVGFYTSKPTFSVYCRMTAGAGAWSCSSDRAVKSDITDIEPSSVLRRVVAMPVTQWRFSGQPADVGHIGPMAQDFYAAFGLGGDEKAISTVDAQGVALAAIQGLNQKLDERDAALWRVAQEKDATITAQAVRIDAQAMRIDALEKQSAEIAVLKQQLAQLLLQAGGQAPAAGWPDPLRTANLAAAR